MYISFCSLKEFWHNRFKLFGVSALSLLLEIIQTSSPLTAVEATSFKK